MDDNGTADVVPARGPLTEDLAPNVVTGESRAPAGQGRDSLATLETRGVDYIPAVERNSGPMNLFWAYFGAQFGYAVYVLGGLLIVFGLDWWGAFSAIVIGTAIGSIVVGPVGLLGPRTGTNSIVSSGAFFGIRGRYLGSIIAQLDNLGFNVIIIWSGGVALEEFFHRLAGTPTGTGELVIGMAIVAIVMSILSLYGHATLIASFKFVAITNGLVMLILVILVAPHFHTHASGVPYFLGSFWPTWLLGLTLGIVNPISYGVGVNDYARRIPANASPRNIALALATGMFLGNALAYLAGAFVTLTFSNVNTPFAQGIMDVSPFWFLIPLAVFGFIGNAVGGGLDMYNATLDLHSIIWRLSRSTVAAIIAVLTFIITYIAVVGYNAVDTVTAFATLLSAVLAPWLGILIVGHFQRGGRYNVVDLHAYAEPGGRGVYWFTDGFNIRALVIWIIATAIGLLFTSSSLYEGPLAKLANGIDLSFISAFIIGAVLYWITGAMRSREPAPEAAAADMRS